MDCSYTAAVVQAGISGFRLACGIDPGGDLDAISETIVNFIGDKGIFMPVQLPCKSTKRKVIYVNILDYKGTSQVSPLIQTNSGPSGSKNISVKILSHWHTYVSPGNDCPGEITLLQSFLKKIGLGVKNLWEKVDMVFCLMLLMNPTIHLLLVATPICMCPDCAV